MSDLTNHPLIQQYIEWNAFGRFLGMSFLILEPGKVRYEMCITPQHLATKMAAHGGAIASLMDAALGVAALSSVCQAQKVVATVSLTMNYLLPAKLNERLVADAQVVKSGKRLQFVECVIRNQDAEIVATGTATMNAYPVAKLMQ